MVSIWRCTRGGIRGRQPFMHFGFHLDGGDEVRAVLARIRADGVEVIEHDDDADGVSFKCVDPDGHRVEVYWEA
jgi:catechol 2,3-dioxygenase-like lactoylglutathione lyase family enzyme